MELSQLSQIQDPKAKLQAYSELIAKVFEVQDTESAKAILVHLLSGEQPVVQVRQILDVFAGSFEKLKNDPLLELGNFAIRELESRVTSFEEEDSKIREQVADVYSAKKDYLAAARVLSAVNLEGTTRSIPPEEKADKYIRIAEYFLECGEEVSAENFNSKAGNVISNVKDISVKLRHRVCHARILDNKKDFLQAARAYYSLSQETQAGVVESDLLQLLQCAITSAILAKAGPQRSRLLATLYKDERAAHLPNFEMLEKMFMQRIVKMPEVKKFEETLQDHHKYKFSSGYTVLETATIEHNIVSISKLYNNISFTNLGEVLQVPPEKAEEIIAKMIEENRITAVLDQINQVVEFETESEGLSAWENQIEILCQSVEKVLEDIRTKYPTSVA